MTPSNPITTLHVRRFIPAPRPRVFAAFTQPEDLTKWLGPGPCQCLRVKVDVRPGGKYEVRMKSFDGGEVDLQGEYLEVRAPERIVMTWQWLGEDWDKTITQVTVDLLEIDGGTDVQLTHERLPSAKSRDNHARGWNGCFDKLEKLFTPGEAQPAPQMPVGQFCWNELLTSDVGVAGKFYTALFGWRETPFDGPVPYTIFRQGEKGVAGMMTQQQPGTPPIWLAYIAVVDCDASAAHAEKLGAKLCMPPKDIPTIGRIAVLTDPLGTPFGIHQPVGQGN